MRSIASVIGFFLCSAQLFAAPVIIDARVDRGEWIGAAHVNDDRAGVLAISASRPKNTRIMFFSPAGIGATIKIDNFAINYLEQLADHETYLAGGSTDNGNEGRYVYRIIRLQPKGADVLWDSTNVSSLGLVPHLAVSDDGKQWASIATEKDDLVIAWGDIGKREATATMTIKSMPVEFPPAFVFDGNDVAFLAPGMIAALSSGHVHVIDLKQGKVRATLAPPSGGSSLLVERPAGLLWVGGNEWAAFRIRDIAEDHEPKRSIGPEKLLRDVRSPIAGGITYRDLPQHATMQVSPRGSAVLVERDGPLGSIIEIRTR